MVHVLVVELLQALENIALQEANFTCKWVQFVEEHLADLVLRLVVRISW